MDLESHAALMAELQSQKRTVPDGPVDPARYAKASTRILWILREVHDTGDERWRLSEFLNTDSQFETYSRRWSTYGLIAKTSHCLLRSKREIGDLTVAEARDSLRDIAVVNLKKVGGASSVNWTTFASELSAWLPYLQKQIGFLNPELVICGGTYELLPKGMAPSLPAGVSSGRDEQRYWVRLPHPGQRTRTQASIYEEMVRDLIATGWAFKGTGD